MLGATVGAVIGGVLKLGQPAVTMLTMAGQCVELPALLLIAGVWPPPGGFAASSDSARRNGGISVLR